MRLVSGVLSVSLGPSYTIMVKNCVFELIVIYCRAHGDGVLNLVIIINVVFTHDVFVPSSVNQYLPV